MVLVSAVQRIRCESVFVADTSGSYAWTVRLFFQSLMLSSVHTFSRVFTLVAHWLRWSSVVIVSIRKLQNTPEGGCPAGLAIRRCVKHQHAGQPLASVGP